MIGFSDEAEFIAAREVLQRANYTQQGIAQRLGKKPVLAVSAVDLPPWLTRTRQLSPLDTLIRLFLLGVSVPFDAAKHAVAPTPLPTWIRAGLLKAEQDSAPVSARLKLVAVNDLVIAADRPQSQRGANRANIVMPPALTSMEVANATIRDSSRRTLDVGTGSGILGLLAAAHSQQVVLTDSNPRAVAIASFNAKLNAVDNTDVREGSLFEPVRDERFDLIVSNPPFVISPANRFLFRDAPVRGDEFCQQLIRSAAARLHNGGYCQLQCNCIHETGEDWKEALTGWFEGLRCDVLVWVLRTEAISDYAMTWIVGTEAHEADRLPAIYDRWMNYYRSQRIEAVSYLLVTLRRTDRSLAWTCVDDTPRRIIGPCANEIASAFALRDDHGSSADEATLLDSHLKLNPDIKIQQSHAMQTDGLRAVDTQLYKTGGTQFTIRVEPHIGAFVARCDGRRTIRDILGEMSRVLGENTGVSVAQTLRIVRTLIDRGILRREAIA
jgi:23S rRNA A1618 N6-methylase RlmF